MNRYCASPYSNYKVLDKDGELIFRCNAKKVNWYLDRNLAKPIDEKTVQLVFSTKGIGHKGDEFYLQDKENQCVVCGSKKELTRHHIVPKCYRKFFPENLKTHTSYDIVVLCGPCHELYEESAELLKYKLSEEFNAPVIGTGGRTNHSLHKMVRFALLLLKKGDLIPLKRIEEITSRLKEFFQKDEITEQDLVEISKADYLNREGYKYHGELVIKQVEDLEEFVKRWRNHFISTMKPKFLPAGWDIERSIWRVRD